MEKWLISGLPQAKDSPAWISCDFRHVKRTWKPAGGSPIGQILGNLSIKKIIIIIIIIIIAIDYKPWNKKGASQSILV